MFPPIAIVGQACVLPGALTPADFWDNIVAGRDLISPPPEGHWGLDPATVLAPEGDRDEFAYSAMGGYVRGFNEAFDPEGFRVPAARIRPLDPLFKWLLHCGRSALRDAGVARDKRTLDRAGVILGNLSYPTRGHANFAQSVWLRDAVDGALPAVPENRFSSGYPAHLLAQALGLGGDSFMLDAACASSLYAIKLACDRLHDGDADIMLAGAVNRADDLFLHIGFTALQALSPSGRSRPFDAAADGLLPAEGAVIVALKRLDDAVRDGNPVHGVIRGIGLSNDGRQRGFFAPDGPGQVKAMRAAYAGSGLTPRDVGYVECHATGTPVGDGVEIESMAEVFAGHEGLPIGSLKSNFGHMITAAGAAGLLKVLAMMKAGVLPPTLNLERPIDDFENRPFRPLTAVADWVSEGPRRAAISSFGFGGNNAHLIVEAIDGAAPARAAPSARLARVAICGLGVVAGNCRGRDAFADALRVADDGTGGAPSRTALDDIELPLGGLHFPPIDLHHSLPQQSLIMEAAFEAVGQVGDLPADRVGVIIGMGCDSEIARYGLRWRLRDLLAAAGVDADADRIAEAGADVMPPLSAAGVLGSMPNIPANRLNVQFDWRGLGFTVSAEELSGLVALRIAARALAAGELDAAVVGAVDLSVEPVHMFAAEALLPADRRRPGDAGVVLVLKRLDDAPRDGDRVLAVLDDEAGPPAQQWILDPKSGESPVTRRFGHAHAASGLMHLAAAVAAPLVGSEEARRVTVSTFSGRRMSVGLTARAATGAGQTDDTPDAGRILRLPAHFPPIRLPWFGPGAGDGASAPALGQTMAPAPRLPAVADLAPVSFAGPAPPPPSAAPGAGPLAEIALLHREHIDMRTRAYREFLAVRDAAWRSYLARGNGRAGPPATVPPEGPPDVPAAVPPRESLKPPPDTGPAEAPAGAKRAPAPANLDAPTGPSFTRRDLERLAAGRVADVFGPLFERQAGHLRQVRMPEPPLLLADRVTGIKGEAGSQGKGTMWTETDVPEDAWYLHAGRMPPGIVIESGQADLLLISWLGADFLNRGERVYRLLGCELTFHEGGLPRPGDTLCYDIHVDGHAKTGDVRLFFFHYDCHIGGRTLLSVREGQAGFFTDAELDQSGGVLWRAEDDTPKPDARLDPPPVLTSKRSFSADDVGAFVAGNAHACFGAGFEMAAAHQRTPTTPSGRMRLIDSVPEFDAQGGPWGRGYLRAEAHVGPDAWFYDGHFKNDPCMPGTLMADAAVQALAFAMAAMGFTIPRDGWRFEPVTDEAIKFICRGQVVPERPHDLTYEVFIEEVVDGDRPTVHAALLCSSDGFKVFQCRRFGLTLVPDWPLSTRRGLIPGDTVASPVYPGGDVRGDFGALLACAWGAPSEAFGCMYDRFDGHRRVPRLPGPPYHFMSRVVDVNCPPAEPTEGGALTVEYDVPPDAWYFGDNGRPVMPFAVLLEVLLQPCGWLASYMGFARADTDLSFRNLDGDDAVLHAPVGPDAGTLRVRTTLARYSRVGDMTIVFFRVECEGKHGPVYSMNTSFGFFTGAALASQVGLATTDAARAARDAASDFHLDLRPEPPELFDAPPRLAGGRLRLIDEVTGLWPDGGEAGLGRIRGRQAIDPDAWYFKAHFYQDPVQAGSLGLEVLIQLLRAYARLCGVGRAVPHARFEPIAAGEALVWKYRGQVLPTNREVVTELEITRVEDGSDEAFVAAKGSLWVDGLRIYEVENLALRIRPAPAAERFAAWDLSLAAQPWIGDHRPTHTVAVLPIMAEVDFAMRAAAPAKPGLVLAGLEDFTVSRWTLIPDDSVVPLRADPEDEEETAVRVRLSSGDGPGSAIATGRVLFAPEFPAPPDAWPGPDGGVVAENPYEAGALFHGPSLQVACDLRRDASCVSFVIDHAQARETGLIAVLDGALHGIPHDAPETWFGEAAEGHIAYPKRIRRLRFFGPLPDSDRLGVVVRPGDFDGRQNTISAAIQIAADETVWCEMDVVETLFPKGPLGEADGANRRAFLGERAYRPSVRLSADRGGETVLGTDAVHASNWLPGTLETAYAAAGDVDGLTREIAVKEYVAHSVQVHPASVTVADGSAGCDALPGTRFPIAVDEHDGDVTVRDAAPPDFDPTSIRDYWRGRLGVRDWPVEEIHTALVRRFVRSVRLEDPAAMNALRGRPALFVANHQVGIESLIFLVAGAAVHGRPLITIAKNEHRGTWLGRLFALCRAYPGARLPRTLLFFDRDDQASMVALVDEVKRAIAEDGLSLMVHVEGTRSLGCRQPVERVSAVFIDLALAAGLPIVPVRFAGGLPVEPGRDAKRLEFPLGYARQDIHLGRPIRPADLEPLPLAERRDLVRDALNALGPDLMAEEPNPPDPDFANGVARWRDSEGMSEARAAVLHALERDPDAGSDLLDVIGRIREGKPPPGGAPEADWLGRLSRWLTETD